jgi:hypothetical protein
MKSFHIMANYSCLFSTLINLYYNLQDGSYLFQKIKIIFMVLYLFFTLLIKYFVKWFEI